MQHRLTPSTAILLTLPPLFWAGNAVVGRIVSSDIPPMTLNLLRWALAFLTLLPLAGWVLHHRSPLWPNFRRYALLGLLSVGSYNGLLYLALHTSTPINVTLVGASTPAFMLAIGALFFAQRVRGRQVLGAVLSAGGVLTVLARGNLLELAQVRFVVGDLYVLVATAAWALYSWLLTQTQRDSPRIRAHWAAFLMAQVVPGLAWSALFTAGEWSVGTQHITWSWPLVAALAFIAIGPSVLAYRCWSAGVHAAGPNVAGLFFNLTPLFAALFSAVFIGETPRPHHAFAFMLIMGGIMISTRR